VRFHERIYRSDSEKQVMVANITKHHWRRNTD
jgi:hypothetical protein